MKTKNIFMLVSITVLYVLLFNQQAFAQNVKLIITEETDMSGDPSYILVGGRPNNIEVGHIKYDKNLDFGKPWVSRFPKADHFGRHSFKNTTQLSGGSQRFIFQYLIQDGCRGCDPLGSAYVAYDFDASGRFLGTKILRFTKETKYR